MCISHLVFHQRRYNCSGNIYTGRPKTPSTKKKSPRTPVDLYVMTQVERQKIHSRKPGRHAIQVSVEVQSGSIAQIGRHSSIQPFSKHVIVVSQKGKQGTPSANSSFCTNDSVKYHQAEKFIPWFSSVECAMIQILNSQDSSCEKSPVGFLELDIVRIIGGVQTRRMSP